MSETDWVKWERLAMGLVFRGWKWKTEWFICFLVPPWHDLSEISENSSWQVTTGQSIYTPSVAICRMYGTVVLLNAWHGHEDRKGRINMSIHVQFDKLMCTWVDSAYNGWIEDRHRQTRFQHHPGVSGLTDAWLNGRIVNENLSAHCVHAACRGATLHLDHLHPSSLLLFQNFHWDRNSRFLLWPK